MCVNVYKNTKAYIVAPANFATGGPELLHQLAHNLIKHLTIKAYMYYIPQDHPNPVHLEYKIYNNPYTREIDDKEENILIIPELMDGINICSNYSKIQKVIWWLSVDNFYISTILKSKKDLFFERLINKISVLILKQKPFDITELALKKVVTLNPSKLFNQLSKIDLHLVQSFYALNHLVKVGISKNKIFHLSDYLNEDFLKIKTDLSKKENIVAYNPKKGFTFTKKIIRQAPGIKFVPLINMSRVQMIETLQKSKVYIDFGNHPGKDRIPREAAILGCCVITGKRGSAAYFEDVPIQESYKFEDKDDNIPKIVRTIESCLENYEERVKDFEFYRKVIRDEPKKFIEDLKNTFKVIK